ncbi:MAG TPA: hypothetical protein VFR78_16795 [Pyrinomonadaceae bacterium]|nr:hypothetical protein [Pyrinomonadaceae bacterium]
MTPIKCSHCDLINWPGTEVCDRCGTQLQTSVTEAQAPEAVRQDVAEHEPLAPVQHDFPALTFATDVSSGSKTLKLILVVLLVLVLGGVGSAIWYTQRANAQRNNKQAKKEFVPPTVEERTRDALLSCLAHPGFVGTKVVEQVLGKVKLELVQVSDREVYFSTPAPEKVGEAFESMIAHFIIDPKRIVNGEDDGTGRLRIGKYSLVRSDDKHFFFKTPIDNIKFDPATVLKFPFKLATYTLNMSELRDFLENKTIFGGRMNARMEQMRNGVPVVFANHGALVARPEETSLRRFVEELTRDIPADSEGAREARVQRVLDFVSSEIKYDLRETTYNFELLKRPNEVLMSGQSDCSNKAILLGSLLEQLGEDYLFVYTPDHITVAVKQGGFPAKNGLFVAWQSEVWLIAEGTAPGFRIGVDRVNEEKRFKQFQHIQRPRDRDVIFDLASGRQLSFF